MDNSTITRGLVAGRYELLRLVGRGGCGEVWHARDDALHRDVAVKVLREPGDLEQEARLAARLSHPNIVAIYDYGDDYIAMEFVDGLTLRERIAQATSERSGDANGRLSELEAMEVAVAVLDALDHAHSRGVLHRDIKPANVLIDGRGRVKVTDFGIAKATQDARASTAVVGTPAYLAPERICGQRASAASDIYSVGCLVHECLTGAPPFGTSPSHEVAMRQVHADVPTGAHPIVVRALQKDPSERFASAAEMIAAIRGKTELIATRRLESSRRATPPWTKSLVVLLALVKAFDLTSGPTVVLPLLIAVALFALGVHLATRRGKIATAFARSDAAIDRAVRFGMSVGSAVLARVRRIELPRIRLPRRRPRTLRERLFRRDDRVLRPVSKRDRPIAIAASVVLLVALSVGGARAITNDPQLPKSVGQAVRLHKAAALDVLKRAVRVVWAPNVETKLIRFDGNAIDPSLVDTHDALDFPTECGESPTIIGAYRCVVWNAHVPRFQIEDPCFGAAGGFVVCVGGDEQVGRYSSFKVRGVTPYSATAERKHPWRLDLADGSICTAAWWHQPLVVDPPDVGAKSRWTPHRWACARGWDKRAVAVPVYPGRTPGPDGALEFVRYDVDDAGHHHGVRLDHSSQPWRLLVRDRSASGYRGVDVVRAVF